MKHGHGRHHSGSIRSRTKAETRPQQKHYHFEYFKELGIFAETFMS